MKTQSAIELQILKSFPNISQSLFIHFCTKDFYSIDPGGGSRKRV